MEGIERIYRMGDNIVRALDRVDLSIEKGEFVTIVGSSGSGKSTLMNLIGCIDAPSGGTFTIEGLNASSLADKPLSILRNKHIGFIFQSFNLLSDLTVVENIALPLVYSGLSRQERIQAAEKYAAKMGLEDRRYHKPTELSGGQSQRVAIARALVNEPNLILADEPTGNLDSVTGREIMKILHELNDQGYTIIMVTHDPELAEIGTRKITIRDGKILSDEPGKKSRVGSPKPVSEKRGDRSGISFSDLLRIGYREGLLAHKMRTALTMLGIIIGVAGVIAMSSFSLGSKKKQANQIRALGANLIRIRDQRLEGEKLANLRIKGSMGLSEKGMDLIRENIDGVKRIAGVREIKMNAASEYELPSIRIIGVSGEYLTVNNLSVEHGRFIDAGDEKRCARVAVLGSAVAKPMGGDEALGRILQLGGTPYRVVGVLANKQIDLKGLEATGARDSNYNVIIPLATLINRTKQLEMRSQLDEVLVQLDTEDRLYEAGTSIRRLISMAHNNQKDFDLVIPLDLLKQKQQARRLLDILTICISSIALIVGGIGIMNIMLASVTERTREIGIRRAVGATRKDIKYQFLSESVLISITGGFAGIILALFVVAVTCTALDLPIVISPLMGCLAVTASTVTGLVFGLFPAIQAASKHPVEALRYE